jgi:hypothetical protein
MEARIKLQTERPVKYRPSQACFSQAASAAPVDSLRQARHPLELQRRGSSRITHFSIGSFPATVASYPPTKSSRKIDECRRYEDYASVSEVPIQMTCRGVRQLPGNIFAA